ncbi:MAG: DUF1697 domain-containing protein [Actinobacteria bacterium]|nr:DUF1697 domain-containing protein [Actinomycetota bacterium]
MAGKRQIALLRAVNLGPTNKVPMQQLREVLTGLGYGDVRTLATSGNVVLTSPMQGARLERELEEVLAVRLGVETRVLVRTRRELAEVVDRNPLVEQAARGKGLHVTFLTDALRAELTRELNAADVEPERIAVRGREIYLWLPEGQQRSQAVRLTADRNLEVTSTRRTWNVVTKLLALADG